MLSYIKNIYKYLVLAKKIIKIKLKLLVVNFSVVGKQYSIYIELGIYLTLT